VVRDAEERDLARGLECAEGGDSRSHRRSRVFDMCVEQVDPFDVETLAALAGRRVDRRGREAFVGADAVREVDAGASWACPDLRGDHDFIGQAAAGSPAAEQRFALAAAAAVVPPGMSYWPCR